MDIQKFAKKKKKEKKKRDNHSFRVAYNYSRDAENSAKVVIVKRLRITCR